MISIREANSLDIPLIRELAGSTWKPTYSGILSEKQSDYMFEKMYSVRSLECQMKELRHVFFIAFEDSEPLGYVSVEQQAENLFHLHKLYVVPFCHGKGIGSLLADRVWQYAREHASGPVCSVELNVNRYNQARLFYEKLGMRQVAEGDFDIGNGYFMNDYIYRVELEV